MRIGVVGRGAGRRLEHAAERAARPRRRRDAHAELDARRRGRPALGLGREVDLQPFLGVIGMPPTSRVSTRPGRRAVWREHRLQGARRRDALYLPISVDGALVSAGDGHAAQGTARSRSSRSRRRSSAPVDTDRPGRPPARNPIAWTPGLADVRLRRGSRRGGCAGDRRDARAHGARSTASSGATLWRWRASWSTCA